MTGCAVTYAPSYKGLFQSFLWLTYSCVLQSHSAELRRGRNNSDELPNLTLWCYESSPGSRPFKPSVLMQDTMHGPKTTHGIFQTNRFILNVLLVIACLENAMVSILCMLIPLVKELVKTKISFLFC